MTYRNNYNGNRNNRRLSEYDKSSFNEISIPLHIHYTDKKEIYLKDGIAHTIAKKFEKISVHQLRKILNQSKICMQELERKDFDLDQVMNMLFSLLPMAAYNAGRERDLKILCDFLMAHLNTKSITCKEDIETFDDLFTSIVAYHKFDGGK